jgi:putative nucleotidyltransferase with HDIG domain
MPDLRARFLDDLDRLHHLPTLPAVVTRLMALVNDPMVSAMDLAYTLREDPPLTARVLRMANSPVYGGRARVLSVPQAVLRLGMNEIRNVVMSLGVVRAVFGPGRRLNHRAFWQHSLTVARATESLASALPPDPDGHDEAAFAVGLLHDIGRLVLDQVYPEAYDAALGIMEGSRVGLDEAERQATGLDHAEIGALLAQRWGLPDPIVSGIAYHHRPAEALPSLRRTAVLARVAEQTAVAHGLGDPVEGASVEEPAEGWRLLGLHPTRVASVVEATVAGARKSALLLSLT